MLSFRVLWPGDGRTDDMCPRETDLSLSQRHTPSKAVLLEPVVGILKRYRMWNTREWR